MHVVQCLCWWVERVSCVCFLKFSSSQPTVSLPQQGPGHTTTARRDHSAPSTSGYTGNAAFLMPLSCGTLEHTHKHTHTRTHSNHVVLLLPERTHTLSPFLALAVCLAPTVCMHAHTVCLPAPSVLSILFWPGSSWTRQGQRRRQHIMRCSADSHDVLARTRHPSRLCSRTPLQRAQGQTGMAFTAPPALYITNGHVCVFAHVFI